MSASRINYDSVANWYDYYVTIDLDVPFSLVETANVIGPVLELAAGTGRLSVPLLEAGVRLTCVDAAPGMLAILSAKLAARGLEAEVVCADICELQLPWRFQLAILPFNAFMEIIGGQRQRQAMAAIAGCLAPGGRFICTLHNPAVRRSQIDGVLRPVGRFPTPEGTLVVSGEERGGDPVVHRMQHFELFADDGRLLSNYSLPMDFALIEKDDFEGMAAEAGLRTLQLFGNYDRSPFDPAASPLMIWLLQKAFA